MARAPSAQPRDKLAGPLAQLRDTTAAVATEMPGAGEVAKPPLLHGVPQWPYGLCLAFETSPPGRTRASFERPREDAYAAGTCARRRASADAVTVAVAVAVAVRETACLGRATSGPNAANRLPTARHLPYTFPLMSPRPGATRE